MYIFWAKLLHLTSQLRWYTFRLLPNKRTQSHQNEPLHKLHLKVFRCIYTLFNAAQRDMECFNQLQMHHYFDILNIKHWILIFKIIKKMKIDFKSEIKSPADVTVNKWVIATEPSHHLNGSLNHSGTNHWDSKHRCSCLELFFVGEMQQKQAIWCLKRKYLNINLLFIELLYKINITFVIMLIFEEKTAPFLWF